MEIGLRVFKPTNISTLLLFVAVTVCLSGAEVKLPFQRRTAQQLRTIKVRCKVTGEDFVAWETPSREARLGQPVIQGVNITADNQSGRIRLKIIGNVTYLLVIEDVKVSDGGNYTCRGSKESRSFTLEIDFVSHGVKTPQILNYGENGTIELGVSAYPPLQYEWHKDGQSLSFPLKGRSIDPYTGTLSIANVTTTDEGNYTCRVLWKADRLHEETEDTVEIQVFVVGKYFVNTVGYWVISAVLWRVVPG